MECNDTDPSSVIQEIDHAVQGIPEHVKLPVELNTYCLKSPLGRMSSCSLYFHGDRTPYDLCQFSGCPDRCLLSGSHNVFRYIFGKFVFAVITDNTIQFTFLIAVDNITGCTALSSVHSHVQRRIVPIRKTSLFIIQLIR